MHPVRSAVTFALKGIRAAMAPPRRPYALLDSIVRKGVLLQQCVLGAITATNMGSTTRRNVENARLPNTVLEG